MSNWRRTTEYRKWRVSVIRRDKVCQVCSTRKHRHAHHINHASFFPEERFDINNGVCLCATCHSNYHNNYHRSTRKKCTTYDWLNFLSLLEHLKEVLK